MYHLTRGVLALMIGFIISIIVGVIIVPLLRKIKYEYPELSNFYHSMKGFFVPMLDVIGFKTKNLTK